MELTKAIVIFMCLSVILVRFPTAKGTMISKGQEPSRSNSRSLNPYDIGSVRVLKVHMAPIKATLDDGIRRSDFKTVTTVPPTLTIAKLRGKRNRISNLRRWRRNPTRFSRRGRKQSARPSTINSRPTKTSFTNTSNPLGSGKVHPCNTVQSSAMNYTVAGIICHRWNKSELQNRMKCMGTYSHRYLASSFGEALRFRDLDTGNILDLTNFYIWHHRSNNAFIKRVPNIKPGETLISQCHAQKTTTESGHLRICPTCAAITRQPATPKRFPEYINELLCDPKMASNFLPGIGGFCVQKSFTLDLLQFTGEWQLDSKLSVEAGRDVYTEKWTTYTQKIRRHCACELEASGPMAKML